LKSAARLSSPKSAPLGNAVTDFFGAFKHKNCSILRISLCDLAGIGRKPTLSLNLERCGICENARFPE